MSRSPHLQPPQTSLPASSPPELLTQATEQLWNQSLHTGLSAFTRILLQSSPHNRGIFWKHKQDGSRETAPVSLLPCHPSLTLASSLGLTHEA